MRALEARYLSTVDAAICTSEYTRDRTTDLVSLPTHVAPPGGRREGPHSLPRPSNPGRPRAAIRFVSPSSGTWCRERTRRLLGALERADRDWTLTVVGSHDADPTYARTVRERGEDRSIASRVTFTGDVDDRTLASILERSHVLAVPSRYEGFGMVYLEAMEFGVVPIATAVGGADEIVTDGENGVLVDPEDTNRLAAEIDRLSADRDRLTNLARGALETAANHPTWAETLADLRAFWSVSNRGVSGGQPADSSGCESDESGSEIP